MTDLMEYKCPKCGGALEFNSKVQKLKCPFCDMQYSMEDFQELDLEDADSDEKLHLQSDRFDWNMDAGSQWGSDETEMIRVYTCESCGGEIVGDTTMASTKCPYCDNAIVLSGRLTGDLKPDYILPFKLDKEDAKSAFTKHLSDKKLLPKEFRDKKKIEEIKGVYVPFWLFDTDIEAAVLYEAKKTTQWRSGDYEYTETSYYNIVREGTIAFDNLPVDGSSKMSDELMESLEPFDFSEAVPFNTGYLAGYTADRYDIDAEKSIKSINRRVRKSTELAFRETVFGYDNVSVKNSFIQVNDNTVKYVLYPVWLLNVVWNNKLYTFGMNGQTGKFVGDLPVDKKAKRRMFFKWFGILSGISAVLSGLIMIL